MVKAAIHVKDVLNQTIRVALRGAQKRDNDFHFVFVNDGRIIASIDFKLAVLNEALKGVSGSGASLSACHFRIPLFVFDYD